MTLELRPMSICDEQDHYVVVVERDMKMGRNDAAGPIVWEHYLGPTTSLERIKEYAAKLGCYGRVRIARLDFLPLDLVEDETPC